jgi:hypothetical protein
VTDRIMPMKNSNDTIGNRTRDLPACRAGPQTQLLWAQCKTELIFILPCLIRERIFLNTEAPGQGGMQSHVQNVDTDRST